jgi:hypothetical protein
MMLPRNFESDRAKAQSASSGPTGPTSAAGKYIVSQNSLKHGLTAKVHAWLPGEEEPYERHSREIFEALAPVGAIEEALARDIAGDRWRLIRARGMENALFSKFELDSAAPDRATANAEAWIDASKGLQRIAGYARSLQRAVDRNSARLEAMQTARKAAHAQAQQEAIQLTQLAESKGQTYDPAPDFPATGLPGGFVYSAPEIARLISRARRLEEAGSALMAASGAGLLACAI